MFIHNTLEDYNHIIDAIDSVSDDALKRHVRIDKGTLAVLNAEKEFLVEFNKIQDTASTDSTVTSSSLEQAIDTTSDSHELAMEDSQKRGADLLPRMQRKRRSGKR